MADKRIKEIRELLDYQRTIRGRSDEERWEAYSFVKHRLRSQTCVDDCPVKERPHRYSSAATDAFQSFIAGFMGAFMSPTQEWFSLRLKSKNYHDDVPPDYGYEFTDYVRRAVKDEFDHSNFYSENELASKDSVCGGYSCTLVQNNPKGEICYYQTLLPWRCWFDMDVIGNWNQFFYIETLNGYQVIEKFPDMDKESKLYKRAFRSGVKGVFQILFAIIERDSPVADKFSTRFKSNMRFASYYISLDTDEVIEEGGYPEFPVAIHIWSKPGDSHYGRGLVMDVLDEIRKLERVAYENGLALAKINHHAWLVPPGFRESFSNDPESRIEYQSRELIPIPLDDKIDLQGSKDALDAQEAKIRHFFHNELFNFFLQTDKVYTATQVNQVKADALSVLAPVFGTIQSQKIDPQIMMTMTIMARNGRLEMDKAYVGEDANYKFEVVLDSAIAQQLATYTQVNSATSTMEMLASMMSLGISDAKDNVDTDNIMRGYMVGVGAPSNYYVQMVDMLRLREERRIAAQEQLELENRKTESEINRNNAGAANLNNSAGFNGGME